MLHLLRKIVPDWALLVYHRFLSWLAAVWYGHPSRELIVIGVTGTNGKTTTTYLTARALEASGWPTGCTTTALFKIGGREWLNDYKMTMLGRFRLQRLLREMADIGCRFAVIETSSQGIAQFRHKHINFDAAVFTNLTPEHIEAHGGFENYKRAKTELFRHLAASPRKVFDGTTLLKTAILNAQDEQAGDFAVKGLDRVVWFGVDRVDRLGEKIVAKDLILEERSSRFRVEGVDVALRLPGRVNVENALAALTVARVFGIDLGAAAAKFASVPSVPGRFERIEAGQPWTVIVDYAPEPESLRRLYDTIDRSRYRRLIHVLGSCGGGRDAARRPILGRLAGEKADVVIVTNEDPYDDDPAMIMREVAEGARAAGKKDGDNLLQVQDRREAILEAMRLAAPGDLVLITGKGSEQAMCLAGGKMVPWDDREVAREAIRVVLPTAS